MNDYGWNLDQDYIAHFSFGQWSKQKKKEYNAWYYKTHKDKWDKYHQLGRDSVKYRREADTAQSEADHYKALSDTFKRGKSKSTKDLAWIRWAQGSGKNYDRAKHNRDKSKALYEANNKKSKDASSRSKAAREKSTEAYNNRNALRKSIESEKNSLATKVSFAAYDIDRTSKAIIKKGRDAITKFLSGKNKKKQKKSKLNYKKWQPLDSFRTKSGKKVDIY